MEVVILVVLRFVQRRQVGPTEKENSRPSLARQTAMATVSHWIEVMLPPTSVNMEPLNFDDGITDGDLFVQFRAQHRRDTDRLAWR